MRYFTTTTNRPVIRLTPFGMQLERVPITLWFVQRDDEDAHHLAPWPAITKIRKRQLS